MKKICTTFLVLALLTGCQGQKEVVREFINTSPTSSPGLPAPPSNSMQTGGVDDGGGGNGLKGKPLESYAFDVRALPEFQTYVLPVIKHLQTTAPNLAADMIYLSAERNWYLVPIKLDQISTAFLGTYFPTDQMAIQSSHDIWMDKNIFDNMAPEDRGRLLVHELLMGIKILEQLSSLEKCFAKQARLDNAKLYKEERMNCFKTYPKISGENSASLRIYKDDYALIRKLTAALFSGDRLENTDLEAELAAHGFRRY